MEVKYSLQGLLIYLAMAGYLSAFVASLVRLRRSGDFLYGVGFIIACVSYIYRWYSVEHVPMQNLFEVFLSMGVIIWPISWFCERILRVGGRRGDMLIGAVVLLPAGFIFSAEPRQLPPALQSWLFGPHVAVYVLSYILMAKAAFQASYQLVGQPPYPDEKLLPAEEATYRMVRAGFPLLTLGLVLGSWWGKLAWGDYWGWDPKELWSLASWLVYVGYFHFRYMFGKKHPRINSAWAIAGMVFIVITLLWVNLSRLFSGLHSYAM
ncbi:MAG: cytochrome c biogenesis protein [Planctomycetota bacterium]|jgi:ABC-type transport system involved in cytochrome c biogenesis permease subunit